MTRTLRPLATSLLAATIAVAGPLACSFSASSRGSSDSSRSSAGSSGSSSRDGTARFAQDVEQYTAAFVKAGGASDHAFFSGLSDLARKRGVSDWEAEPGTWEAVGRGLRRAEPTDAERAAYEQAWAGDDADRERALDQGYATR